MSFCVTPNPISFRFNPLISLDLLASSIINHGSSAQRSRPSPFFPFNQPPQRFIFQLLTSFHFINSICICRSIVFFSNKNCFFVVAGDGAKSNSMSIEKKIEFLESFTGKVCVCSLCSSIYDKKIVFCFSIYLLLFATVSVKCEINRNRCFILICYGFFINT